MTARIQASQLQAYRDRTFHRLPDLLVKNANQAVDFVNERGFVCFWPIKDLLMPSLWVAAAGDRPISDNRDDPGHKTWGWKDALLGKRRWYYGRIIRHRNTMISIEALPYFYALSENYGDPENDYLMLYKQGRLTQEAKVVYEALLQAGPLDTLALRKAAHLASRESDARFNKAIGDLQEDFKILPIGVADVGPWHYAFIYDLTTRHFPDIPEKARFISERSAQAKLLEYYLCSVGVAEFRDCQRCFGWTHDTLHRVISDLSNRGLVSTDFEIFTTPVSGVLWHEVLSI